jgi:hypothetical protein
LTIKVTKDDGGERHLPKHVSKPLKSYSFEDFYRFKSGHKTPVEAVKAALQKYRGQPSASTANKLEMAINRISASDEHAPESAALIKEALSALAAKTPKGQDGFEGDNVAATVFVNSDFGGASLFCNLPQGGPYTGFEDLSTLNFNDKISSVKLTCSPDEVSGEVFLFENARFDGKYIQLEAAAGEDTSVSYVGSYINDKASSLLVYRHFPHEFQFAMSDFISESTVKPLIDSQDHLSSRGEVILTWDMYPDGKDGHPNTPWMTYAYIRIPVTVHPPGWAWDYDAEIRFWIAMWVNADGTIGAAVEFYGSWVEGGLITGDIQSKLMSGIEGAVPQVSSLISGALQSLNMLAAPFSNLYFLPGRDQAKGNTDEDLTIVLVQGMPIPPAPIV